MELDIILSEFVSQVTPMESMRYIKLSPTHLYLLYFHAEKILLFNPSNRDKLNILLYKCGLPPLSNRNFFQEEINSLLTEIYSAPPLSSLDLFRANWRFRLRNWTDYLGVVNLEEERSGPNSVYRGGIYILLSNGTFKMVTQLITLINYYEQRGNFRVIEANNITPLSEIFPSENLEMDFTIQRKFKLSDMYDTYKRSAHALTNPKGNVVTYFQRLMGVIVSYPEQVQPVEIQFYMRTKELKINKENRDILAAYVVPLLERFRSTTTGLKM